MSSDLELLDELKQSLQHSFQIWQRQMDYLRDDGISEVGQLATRFSNIMQRLGSAMDLFQNTIKSKALDENPDSATNGAGIPESANTVVDIIEGIQSDVNDALVSLQYQDRASQILENMIKNIGKTESCMVSAIEALEEGNHDQFADSVQWLEKMEEEYTTLAERTIHGEVSGELYDEESNKQSSEVSFF